MELPETRLVALLADGITEEAVSFVAFRTSMEGFANTTTIGALPAVAVVDRSQCVH